MTSLKNFVVATLLIVVSVLNLTACSSEEPVPMAPSEITRFVLDLSGSNDYLEQYRRLKPKIYEELKSESLGNPYAQTPSGPVELSITFIMSVASRARIDKIVSSEFAVDLFNDLSEVYGRSGLQKEQDWLLVLAAYREALQNFYASEANCVTPISEILVTRLGRDNSKTIATSICNTTKRITDIIENEIPKSLSPGGGSDIFGALKEIESWANEVKEEKPDSSIRVVFGSDMVHNADSQRDLFGRDGLLTNKIDREDICLIAQNQASISALKLSGVTIDVIGRGNASSIDADEASALADFWKCFSEAQDFKINFITDGNG